MVAVEAVDEPHLPGAGYPGKALVVGEMLRVRTISRLGIDVRVGIGPSITVAATASAQVPGLGGVLAIDPGEAAAWLAHLPVDALNGIGPRQAEVLVDYGIHCIGLLATVPPATIQRLLGGRAGRTAADRARGIDPRPVVPRALPAAATVRHAFPRHTLDGAAARAALLDLVIRLGLLLRRRDQASSALTLKLTFARRRQLGEDPPPAGAVRARRRSADSPPPTSSTTTTAPASGAAANPSHSPNRSPDSSATWPPPATEAASRTAPPAPTHPGVNGS
ncbi:hypothetical protein [Streptomyces sp. NBC_01017]|uniref:hypothetical protein n=1 Tax=Streptomyces sp. NBC_01017 TaxID=2903721 RepID=UPI00386330CA